MHKAIDYRHHIDPEYQRWGRKYRRFPGVAECVRLLHCNNVHGAWIDVIIYELTAYAEECLPELVAVFRSDDNLWVRLMILIAITEARLPDAVEFLAEVAQERDKQFRDYAEAGLCAIGTREARTALWRVREKALQ